MNSPYQYLPDPQPTPSEAELFAAQQAQYDYEDRKKSNIVMWLLWLFTGLFGGHRYYIGNIGYGVAMTFTLGGLGIWTLLDALVLSQARARRNREIKLSCYALRGVPQYV